MDSRFCAQDVIRCDNCEKPVPTRHCELCQIYLCKDLDCVGEHLEHRLVSFEKRRFTIEYPYCNTHSPENERFTLRDATSPFLRSSSLFVNTSFTTIAGNDQEESLETRLVSARAKQGIDRIAIPKEEHSGPRKTSGAVSSLHAKPQIILEIITDCGERKRLLSVSCLGNSEFWTSAKDNILRLYNLQGELLKSGRTKSGNRPSNIAVIKSGDLVYTDHNDRSINILKNTNIDLLVRLRGWLPLYVCGTSSTDLLVIMISDDEKKSKVVRYSGFTETQSIQTDDFGHPLYSTTYDPKFLSENKNLDICVADYSSGAVVVVSAAGKLRYRYIGPPSATRRPFQPLGIATDSRGRILVSEYRYHSIHIVDQNGQFLCYIDNLGLKHPWGLCVASKDNLFVAETATGNVKKMQYYK